MSWKIEFYEKNVEDSIKEWPESILAKFLWIVEILKQFGPIEIGMPYVKAMGNGLLEIRAKGKDGIGRAIFCTVIGKKIIILNAFIKKTEKTPQNEINQAKKRMTMVRKNG